MYGRSEAIKQEIVHGKFTTTNISSFPYMSGISPFRMRFEQVISEIEVNKVNVWR
jgi:hypothetical protein